MRSRATLRAIELNATLWLWLSVVVEIFTTRALSRIATTSSAVSDTVWECTDEPLMSSSIAPPALSWAAVISALWDGSPSTCPHAFPAGQEVAGGGVAAGGGGAAAGLPPPPPPQPVMVMVAPPRRVSAANAVMCRRSRSTVGTVVMLGSLEGAHHLTPAAVTPLPSSMVT